MSDLISEKLQLTEGSLVLDYGCGLGRLSRELIRRHKCFVIGVDISSRMRALAVDWVGSPNFTACSAEYLPLMRECDAAICVWTLQHCLKPHDDLDNIKNAMKDWSKLFVVNSERRWLPTTHEGEQAWIDDKLDMKKIIPEKFSLVENGECDPAFVSDLPIQRPWWGLYVK